MPGPAAPSRNGNSLSAEQFLFLHPCQTLKAQRALGELLSSSSPLQLSQLPPFPPSSLSLQLVAL